MLKYKAEQKVYKVGKYNIGGDPRETPVAMIGTIFYYNQKHVFKDEKNGIIDVEYAEKLIKDQMELADKTGLTPGLDVIISFESGIKPIVDFIADHTEIPIFLDPPTWELKKPTLEYLRQTNIQDRIVYNSILPEAKDDEFQMLEESKIKNFVLLAMESTCWTTQARMDIIKKMVDRIAGTKIGGYNFLVDGCVLDLTSLGLAMNAMEQTKDTYGFPVGSGAHNAVDTWRNLKAKFGDIKKYASVVASTITLAAGADFLLYGPLQHADIMFPNAAFIKSAFSQLLFDEGRMPPPEHSVFKIG